MTVRTLEDSSKETFVDANDLLIELMMAKDECTSEEGKRIYAKVIKRITEIRNKSQGKKDVRGK